MPGSSLPRVANSPGSHSPAPGQTGGISHLICKFFNQKFGLRALPHQGRLRKNPRGDSTLSQAPVCCRNLSPVSWASQTWGLWKQSVKWDFSYTWAGTIKGFLLLWSPWCRARATGADSSIAMILVWSEHLFSPCAPQAGQQPAWLWLTF